MRHCIQMDCAAKFTDEGVARAAVSSVHNPQVDAADVQDVLCSDAEVLVRLAQGDLYLPARDAQVVRRGAGAAADTQPPAAAPHPRCGERLQEPAERWRRAAQGLASAA